MSVLTKKALVEAFGKLIAKKPFSKITVSDITAECGVSRMTFYYHFNDIYDLLEWSLKTQLEKAIHGNYTYDTWQKGFLNVFYFAIERKSFVLNIFPQIEQKNMKKHLHSLAYKFTLGVIEDQYANTNTSEKDKRFIADTFAHAAIGVLISWVNNGMKEDPRIIVGKFALMFEGIFSSALEKLNNTSENEILSLFDK